MGRRRKSKDGLCPHCNTKLEFENGENGYETEYWFECKTCGRSYDIDTEEDITEYKYISVKTQKKIQELF